MSHELSQILQVYLVPDGCVCPITFPHTHGHASALFLYLSEVGQCRGNLRERTYVSGRNDMQPKSFPVRTPAEV